MAGFTLSPLFMAQFLFFSQFGTFIGMITLFSIIWAVFFLMTLSLTVGPEPIHGDGTGPLYGEVKFLKACGKTTNKAGEEGAREPTEHTAMQEGANEASEANSEVATSPPKFLI